MSNQESRGKTSTAPENHRLGSVRLHKKHLPRQKAHWAGSPRHRACSTEHRDGRLRHSNAPDGKWVSSCREANQRLPIFGASFWSTTDRLIEEADSQPSSPCRSDSSSHPIALFMTSLVLPLFRSRITSTSTARRGFQSTAMSLSSKLKPAARVAGRRQDVWCVLRSRSS